MENGTLWFIYQCNALVYNSVNMEEDWYTSVADIRTVTVVEF